jgi:hypothetical protein
MPILVFVCYAALEIPTPERGIPPDLFRDGRQVCHLCMDTSFVRICVEFL